MIEALKDAMRMADTIRHHLIEAENNGRLVHDDDAPEYFVQMIAEKANPGLLEGAAVAVATAAALSPLRGPIFRVVGHSIVPEILVNTTHLLGSLQVGLYMGSLIGSHSYLQQLARLPPATRSPTADAICREPWVQSHVMDMGPAPIITNAWDPRQETLRSYYRAMQHCQARNNQS